MVLACQQESPGVTPTSDFMFPLQGFSGGTEWGGGKGHRALAGLLTLSVYHVAIGELVQGIHGDDHRRCQIPCKVPATMTPSLLMVPAPEKSP